MYIGRFAPTPSGPLHFGSIVTAVASYLDAKKNNGLWKIRIDDLDKPRIALGAERQILSRIESLGLIWDGKISYQSNESKNQQYTQALDKLNDLNITYACECSRKKILTNVLIGIDGPIYDKECLTKNLQKNKHKSIRLKVTSQNILFKDTIQGDLKQNLEKLVGDFILKRSDNVFSYQLAVVIDDYLQSVSHVIRGSDLLNSTTRQIYIGNLLGLPLLQYMHVPLACIDGKKLSKANSNKIILNNPNSLLIEALKFLNQKQCDDLKDATVNEIIKWSILNWDINRIPKKKKIEISSFN